MLDHGEYLVDRSRRIEVGDVDESGRMKACTGFHSTDPMPFDR
jgi:hypothetical protein